jgi:hypothetical protein
MTSSAVPMSSPFAGAGTDVDMITRIIASRRAVMHR